MSTTKTQDLTDRRILVPGGTGLVGEGIVRQHLAAGAHVVVPSRTEERAEEFRRRLGAAATDHLHLMQHDYSTFAGAEELGHQMAERMGGIDAVVVPVGTWWQGRTLAEIDEGDWTTYFGDLITTHMAIARATVPRLSAEGSYTIIVGDSATWPVPGSGLVSMVQAAMLMLHRVLDAESQNGQRHYALTLGPVGDGGGTILSADIGRVATTISAGSSSSGLIIPLHSEAEVEQALLTLRG